MTPTGGIATGAEVVDPVARFGLLASAIAGRPLVVAGGAETGWTDGRTIFVSADDDPRYQVIAMSAMIGAGSLDRDIVQQLTRHSRLTRRYLAVEGRRALAGLVGVLPSAVLPDPGPLPAAAADVESSAAALLIARTKVDVPAAPSWFGELRPKRVDLRAGDEAKMPGENLRLEPEDRSLDEGAERSDGQDREKRDKKSGAGRFGDHPLGRAVRRLFGTEYAGSGTGEGAELKATSARTRGLRQATTLASSDVAVDPTNALAGTSGFAYPEWDEREQAYRPGHCRVVEFLPGPHDLAPLDRPARNDALRRELGRLGLGPRRERKQRAGYDLDLDAAVDAHIVMASGRTPHDTVYVDNLRHARELSVLVLLDASGSGEERTPDGATVFELQRTATAALVDSLTQLGERVAAYAFRSGGRQVSLTRLKRFDELFGNATLHRIGGVQSGGFTRFGGAIRHSTRLLCTEGGTVRRLLVVISDGFPYDDGYEGFYAEGDVRKALDEARASGVGCLCLNLGSSTAPEALSRIYARTEHATSESLDELTPSILTLFHGALRRSDLRRGYGAPRLTVATPPNSSSQTLTS